jgi:hypothetical protein
LPPIPAFLLFLGQPPFRTVVDVVATRFGSEKKNGKAEKPYTRVTVRHYDLDDVL